MTHQPARQPDVKAFFDPATNTVSYVVSDPATKQAAIVDSVLDYDPKSGRTSKASADAVIAFVREQGFTVQWILETHVHADHLSAAPYLKDQVGGTLAIGSNIRTVQDVFGKVFNAGTEFARDGSQFDRLFEDGETFMLGQIEAKALHTPGHTPACMTYVIGDAAFVGDTLFMPDYGTARCDFPGGSASDLFKTIQRFYTLADDTTIYLCHDYPDAGEAPLSAITVGEEKRLNVQIKPDTKYEEYVSKREARDATLSVPKLLYPSLQTNLRLGDFGVKSENGLQYIKIPINAL